MISLLTKINVFLINNLLPYLEEGQLSTEGMRTWDSKELMSQIRILFCFCFIIEEPNLNDKTNLIVFTDLN